jgi:hypothetical protein
MYELYIDGVLFPVTPGSLNIKTNNKNKTITLINEGEVNYIKSPGLSDITIPELLLPIHKYPFSQEKAKVGAAYYLSKLEKWKNQKKPVVFKLLRYEVSQKHLIEDITTDVTIEDYEIMEDVDKYGSDVCVKLNMKQYRHWGAKKLVLKSKKTKSGKKKTVATVKKQRKKTKAIAKNYKIKSGDTLMKIAKKQMNNASAWKKLYQLNQKTIENAARKHGRKSSSNGHYLYVGTVLKLPGGGS